MITPSVSSRRAFTLIELLVVISIIAILATLLFPAVSSALYQAKKTQAKNDASQIALAISAFDTEYGRYPIPGSAPGDYTSGSDNSAVMNILSPTSTTTGTTDNPRAMNFLEIPNTTSGKNGRLNGGGSWNDPWGQPYFIAMDGDYDSSQNDPTGAGTIRKGVLVWSKGDKQGHPSDYGNPAKWLKSWE